MSSTQEAPTQTPTDALVSMLEVTLLENLFNEECKCEINHTHTSCSVEVTHARIVSCTGNRLLMCQNAASGTNRWIEERSGTCAVCGNNVADCWAVVPV